MHPNPIFRKTGRGLATDFARARGFGTLALNGRDAPLLAHVPFRLDQGGGVEMHLMRSNPVWRALAAPAPAVLSVTGPDGYVSPDWYGQPDQVPTWNYVAVHLRGTLHRMEPGELRGVLDRLSAEYETRIAGKTPWTSAKMTPQVLERMMRMIAPCRLTVTDVQSTFKLGQNKPDDMRLAAAGALLSGTLSTGTGAELRALADWMRAPPETEE